MDKNELKKAIEAILFTLGEAVEANRIAEALDVSEKEIFSTVREMKEEMDKNGRGVTITQADETFRMCTKKETYDYLIKIISVPKENRLSDVQLETLSIIAYKQPVTKLEIENIRGVNSDYAVNRLVEYGLVEEKGRLNAPGRPYEFGTTREFLQRFGLRNLDDLPGAGKAELFNLESEKDKNEDEKSGSDDIA